MLKKGFTVMEMILVMSVLGFLMAMVIPNMSRWYTSLKINNAKRDLISNIRLVQQYTVTSQINHSVKLDVAQNRYQLIKKNEPDQVLKTIFLPTSISFNLITLNPLNNEIEFNAAGVPSSVGNINLINTYGVIKGIEITPSGFVKEL